LHIYYFISTIKDFVNFYKGSLAQRQTRLFPSQEFNLHREEGGIGCPKLRLLNNREYLNGFNDSFAQMRNILLKDRISYGLSSMENFDKILSSKFNGKCLQELDILKTILRNSSHNYFCFKAMYYNQRTKSMVDFIPITELDPLISYKYYYMRELLRLKNITPMNVAELQAQRTLWNVFNKASADLHSSLQNKLTQFEQISHKIRKKVEQCLVHVVTCQSHDGISYVYGNIFALVKLGFFTTVWYNYTKCDPSLYNGDILPDGFLDLFCNDKSNIPGYTKFVFMETQKNMTQSIVEAFEEAPFKDMLDSIHKLELEEFETLPDEDDAITSIRGMNTMKDSKLLAGIGLGVLVCFCIAAGVLPDWNNNL
jgi:hypothetical protein